MQNASEDGLAPSGADPMDGDLLPVGIRVLCDMGVPEPAPGIVVKHGYKLGAVQFKPKEDDDDVSTFFARYQIFLYEEQGLIYADHFGSQFIRDTRNIPPPILGRARSLIIACLLGDVEAVQRQKQQARLMRLCIS